MILWLTLFILVIAISFVLALLSMRDFQGVPHSQSEYGLFLIRQPAQFRADVLNLIHTRITEENLIVSIERLLKGKKSTLVIFGPKKVLESLPQLDLLELEDYTDINREDVSVWEVGVRSNKDIQPVKSFFTNLPQLDVEEEFWWQIVLGPSFQSQIRAVLVITNLQRRQDISQNIQRLDLGRLTKIPKPFTTDQFLDFYLRRSLNRDSHNPILTPQEVLQLILLS